PGPARIRSARRRRRHGRTDPDQRAACRLPRRMLGADRTRVDQRSQLMPATPNLGLPYPSATDTADIPRDIKALADKLDAGAIFIVGEVRLIAVPAPPSGWLVADGRPVSRSTYAKLYAAI